MASNPTASTLRQGLVVPEVSINLADELSKYIGNVDEDPETKTARQMTQLSRLTPVQIDALRSLAAETDCKEIIPRPIVITDEDLPEGFGFPEAYEYIKGKLQGAKEGLQTCSWVPAVNLSVGEDPKKHFQQAFSIAADSSQVSLDGLVCPSFRVQGYAKGHQSGQLFASMVRTGIRPVKDAAIVTTDDTLHTSGACYQLATLREGVSPGWPTLRDVRVTLDPINARQLGYMSKPSGQYNHPHKSGQAPDTALWTLSVPSINVGPYLTERKLPELASCLSLPVNCAGKSTVVLIVPTEVSIGDAGETSPLDLHGLHRAIEQYGRGINPDWPWALGESNIFVTNMESSGEQLQEYWNEPTDQSRSKLLDHLTALRNKRYHIASADSDSDEDMD